MKVLVMDTGRGINAEKVALWRSHLGLVETDQLVLVSWFRPQANLPLPVTTHLVCGPVLNLGQEPARLPVRSEWPEPEPGPDLAEGAAHSQLPAAEPPWVGADEVMAGADGLGVTELDEQLTEQEANPGQAAAADRESHREPDREAGPSRRPTDLSHLPLHHPRRLRQAIRWRRKWAQRRASRFTSRQVRRARSLTDRSSHLPSVLVTSSLRSRKDALSWEYTLATTRSRTVNAAFRTADVVVPVDQRSQKAAWLLARRHAGPDVIVTLPAAARAVAARRSPG